MKEKQTEKYNPRKDKKPLSKKQIAELRRKLKDKNYQAKACEVVADKIAKNIN